MNESGTVYNLTTIEPDEETITTLIDAVDTAVDSLQAAIGGSTTTDSSFGNYDFYDPGDFDASNQDLPDYFTGNEDLFDEEDFENYEYYEEIDYSQGLTGNLIFFIRNIL